MIRQTLRLWAECWPHPWCLYRETLLCANGLDDFPAYLPDAQIAIRQEDAEQIRTLPLPDDWRLFPNGGGWTVHDDASIRMTVSVLDTLNPTETISCGENQYPADACWRDYLRNTYGDYEHGLTDDIGVGLTAEEKISLVSHQEKCREALAFLQKLAQKHNLRYYLLAGSVLGAVRHGGFIPWDDDVDVGIRIEDLAEFESIVKDNLPAGFTLMQAGAGCPYPRMFSKICWQGRCCVDLWPLVPIRSNGFGAKFTWYFARIITKIHYCKIGYTDIKHSRAAKILSHLLTDRAAMALARWNERKGLRTADAYCNLYSVYSLPKETIPKVWLDTPATEEFAGITVPVVGCTHDYLTHLYGDYMKFPAPWKRASRHFERF